MSVLAKMPKKVTWHKLMLQNKLILLGLIYPKGLTG